MTAIEWTDATWNPVTGCDRVSPGCDNCYALTLAARLKAMGQAKYQRDRYREAVRESDLCSSEKHVALEMAEYMDRDSLASCHPGRARIARRTSLSESTVKRAIKSLCGKGWLRLVHKGGSHPGQRRASIYMGTYPCHSVTGTRDTVSTDPCHSVTPPSQGSSQHQGGAGNERTATPLEGVDGASSGKAGGRLLDNVTWDEMPS